MYEWRIQLLGGNPLLPSARPHERFLPCTPGCNMQQALPLHQVAANAASDMPCDIFGVCFQGEQGRGAVGRRWLVRVCRCE